VRFPNPARDTHLSRQLILPPLSTGPDQTPHEKIGSALLAVLLNVAD
jgi:hypothetical protein